MNTNVAAKNILVVEDNIDDVFFLQRTLKKAGLESSVEVASDGEQAMQYLSARITQKEGLPRIMMLDLNLPRVNGFELIGWVRSQPALSNLILAVVTSSSDDRDVQKAYDAGAHTYLLKYPSLDDLAKLMKAVETKKNGDGVDLPGLRRA